MLSNQDNGIHKAFPLAQEVGFLRRSFLAMVKQSGISGTSGSCLYAAFYTMQFIKRFHPEVTIKVRGGSGENGTGFRDFSGRHHGHYWTELTFKPTAENQYLHQWVLDITADQFGFPPVVAQPSPIAQTHYIPGPAEQTNEHLRELVDQLSPFPMANDND